MNHDLQSGYQDSGLYAANSYISSVSAWCLTRTAHLAHPRILSTGPGWSHYKQVGGRVRRSRDTVSHRNTSLPLYILMEYLTKENLMIASQLIQTFHSTSSV
jgi:hypothetical protein